ncbi:hypothetical protein [Negadavirga shengliensis]|uniref:Uncharacterized protein n=1 Tax=Negadavirga shengliensis TaxID=1389218 RepID=A0ABV9T7Q6_9BACT
MRKIISILLLACFLVYHFGYYVFYFSYQHLIETDWTSKVYREDFHDYKVMKIPMKLPYSFEEEGFQLTNIPFKKDGKSYRAIKKRFADDTFELLYVPDMAKIKLEVNLKQWVISISSEASAENNKDKVVAKTFIKDFIRLTMDYCFKRTFYTFSWHYGELNLALTDTVVFMDAPPPESSFS